MRGSQFRAFANVVSLRHCEFALARIEVPASLASTHGDRQWGVHVDAVVPIVRFRLLGLSNSSLAVGARFEHVDYHGGELRNGDRAGDDVTALAGSLALRPGTDTVFRLNYASSWARDLLRNAPARSASLQLGLATYF